MRRGLFLFAGDRKGDHYLTLPPKQLDPALYLLNQVVDILVTPKTSSQLRDWLPFVRELAYPF